MFIIHDQCDLWSMVKVNIPLALTIAKDALRKFYFGPVFQNMLIYLLKNTFVPLVYNDGACLFPSEEPAILSNKEIFILVSKVHLNLRYLT